MMALLAMTNGTTAKIRFPSNNLELLAARGTRSRMRFCFGLVLAFFAGVLRAEIPALLDAAWTNYVKDIDHWAYTETTHAFDATGKQTRETVTRYDPSQPYADQFTILSHNGKPPTDEQVKQARQRGIARGERLERPGGQEYDTQPRVILNGAPALADLEHATVVEETAQSVTYAVPMRRENSNGFPVEKFLTHVRVNKTEGAFEHVTIRLAAPVRMKVIAKMNEADFSIDFAAVDPRFSRAGTLFKDHLAISVFFRKREGGHESARGDFKRVTPYRDRFGVKAGPMRTIDF